MSNVMIFYPVLLQVSLTFLLLYKTGRIRIGNIRRGEVKISDIALGQPAWPAHATQVANAYNSQFQLPVLFYMACLVAQINTRVDAILVALAWGFVATRLAHAWIYISTNNVRHRFYAFVAGFELLVVLWLYLAYLMIAKGV